MIVVAQPPPRSPKVLWKPNELTQLPDLEWLWENWMPKNELVLLAAKQGSGKSTLAYQISQAVADGGQMPDGSYADEGNVLYFDLESSPEATGKRFRELEVRSESMSICFLESIPEGTQRLDFMLFLIRNGQYDLAIVDSYRGLRVGDEKSAAQTRETLDKLISVGHEHGTTILLIHHLNKRSKSSNDLDRVSGSSDLTARPRIVWLLQRDGEERVLKVGKTNLGPEPTPIQFEMKEGGLVPTKRIETLSALEQACQFLQSALSERSVSAREIYQTANERGISKRTLERAKRVIGVRSERKSGGWVWAR